MEIAHAVAAFLDGAQHTLDLAQYDFNLTDEARDLVVASIKAAASPGSPFFITHSSAG